MVIDCGATSAARGMHENGAPAVSHEAVIGVTAASMRGDCDQLLDPSAAAALCLSAELLHALYAHFEAVGWSSVQSPAASADRFEAVGSVGLPDSRLLEDVQFLYDLVQLSPRLRLHADSCGPPSVQLVAFRRLELLELESVPVSVLHGLRHRRPYLRALRCSGSCLLADGELAELLAHCGADRSSPLLWDELAELIVTCCPTLTRLDDSLKLLPRLRQLDLTQNRLENVQDLVHLNELQSVNLGFNDLTGVPAFSHVSCVTLSWLSLANNRIEFLNGLEDLVGLEHLDLGYNCLVSHALLWPLSELAKLRYLQLFGNPLCCISKHRVSTIRMLHDQCQSTQFVLDSRFLRRWEMSVRPLERLVRSSLRTVLLRRPPTPLVHARLPPKHTVESVDSTPASVRRRRFNKRRTRAIIANISDMDGADGQSTTDAHGCSPADGRGPAATVNGDSCSLTLSSSLSIADVPSHLVTRDQIQSLRRELGAEDWLHSHGASMVQELLGLPQQPPPNFTIAGAIDAGYTPSPQQNGLVHTPPTPTGSTPRPVDISPSDGVYSRRTTAALQSHTSAKSIDGAAGAVDSSVYGRDTEEESESEDEENLCLILARLIRKNSEQDIMLTVTPTSVKEKELDSARTSAQWDLQSVEACHVIRSDPLTVQLNFDTVRRDKRERNYTMEASEWKELRGVLSPIIEARLASELAANVLQCMKCNAEFSEGMAKTAVTLQDRNGGSFRHVKRCPNCDSDMIIHVEKMSHPNLDVSKSNNIVHLNAARQSRLKRRSSSKNMLSSTPKSVSSVTNAASADGVSESASSQSPSEHSSGITVVAEIHTESSSISVLSDDPGDVTEHQSKGDSDVDVISNPSESSIEVLPDAARRFRPIVSASHVLEPTVAEESGTKSGLPMEESSSSGSMSTSVTTVRERGSDVGGASPRRPDELTTEVWLCEDGDPPVELGRERLRFWPQDPRRCDHRIRLHLDLNVLQSSEQLSWIIQCTCGMDPDFNEFPCLLVMTNVNLYLLEIAAESNVDVCSRLRVRVSHQLTSLSAFGELFDQQGVSISFRDCPAGARLLIILRDQRRGSRLMQLLQECRPDVSIDVSWLEAQSNMVQHMLSSDPSADAALQHVLRVDLISQSTLPDSVVVPVMLCVTRSDLLMVDGLLRWLLPQNVTDKIPIRDQEKTAHLSKLEILRSGIPAIAASGSSVGWTVRLTFVDPSGGTSGAESHSWLLQLATRESVRYLVTSLQSVWKHSQSSGDDDAPQLPVTLV